jgi:RNA processing factor Prp31
MLYLTGIRTLKGDGKEYEITRDEFTQMFTEIMTEGYSSYRGERVVLPDHFLKKKVDMAELSEILNSVNKKLLSLKLREDQIIEKIITTLDEMEKFDNFLEQKRDETSLFMKYSTNTNDEFSRQMERIVGETRASIKNLESVLEEYVTRNAPNLSRTVGYKVAARLMKSLGGLRNIALTSSSTVQIIGAEKAFFRYKKGRGTPPKHGIIFEIPDIYRAPPDISGKIARAYANAIVKAARADIAGLSSEVDQKLRKRIAEIRSVK